MIVVSDAVAAIDRATHEAGPRIFADVKTTDKVVQMFHSIRS